MSLHGMLVASAKAHSEKTAFNVLRGGRWASITYREFLAMSGAASVILREAGLSRGGRAAIVAENRPEWCAFHLGALMRGAAAVPMDMKLTPGEMRNLLEHSESKILVCSSETEKAAAEAARGLDMKIINMDSVSLAPSSGAGEAEYEEVPDEELASLLYTSGTTGVPKGVMLSHKNICSDAEAMAALKTVIGPGDNVLSALPLHHTYPFMCTYALPLLVGASVTYPAGLKGAEMADASRSTGVTVLVAVPLMLELMRDAVFKRLSEASRAALPAVKACGLLREKLGVNIGRRVFARRLGGRFRFFACGGARLDPQVMRDLEALGFSVVEGYGLTETSPIVAFNPVERRKPGSAGLPVKGAEMKILNPDEKGVGEVAIRGPMVMQGYFKNPEATASVFREGFFLSGDLGYIDAEGYLFITGRSKEVIVLGSGKNVYPEDVEKLYMGIPLIKEICVVGREGRLHAVIVPDAKRPASGNMEDALRGEVKKVSEEIASHMRITGYTLVEGPLPRTPLGKLRRFMVAELLKGKRAQREEDPALADEFSRRVINCLKPLSGEPGPFRSTDDLELDLGLDSLKRLEMVSALEVEFSLKLPGNFSYEVRTVGELVKRLREAGESGGGIEEALWGEPSGEEKKRAGLVRGPLEWPVSAACALFLRFIFRLLFGLDVRGVEKIPAPPFIIAPNHTSNMDGLVFASSVPLRTFRRLYFQGYFKYFEGPVKSLVGRLAHVISIDPAGRLGGALRLSHHVLAGGDGLCLFPEGQRSTDGELGVFKRGIGTLARKLDVPVVPARIEGTLKILPRGRLIPRIGKIRVTFGEPLKPSSLDYSKRPDGVDEDQHLADALREKVKGL